MRVSGFPLREGQWKVGQRWVAASRVSAFAPPRSPKLACHVLGDTWRRRWKSWWWKAMALWTKPSKSPSVFPNLNTLHTPSPGRAPTCSIANTWVCGIHANRSCWNKCKPWGCWSRKQSSFLYRRWKRRQPIRSPCEVTAQREPWLSGSIPRAILEYWSICSNPLRKIWRSKSYKLHGS